MDIPSLIEKILGAPAKKSVIDNSSQPIATGTKEIALTNAEEILAVLPQVTFNDNEIFVRDRLTKILNVVESRDYSQHSDMLRPLLYDIENPTKGGVYIKGTPGFSWNWKYKSTIDKKNDTMTYIISLSNGMGRDKVNIMSLKVKTTLRGRIKSLDAKYHIDSSIIIKDFATSRSELSKLDNIGTRHIEMNFTDGSRVETTETEYCLDLLGETEHTPEEQKKFLVGTPMVYPTLINPDCKLKTNTN